MIVGSRCSQRPPCSLSACLLVLQAVLLFYSASVCSPVYSEVGHLPAGLIGLLYSRFDLYAVSPPLIHVIAAIPVACATPQYDWTHSRLDPQVRPEVEVARDFMRINGPQSLWYYAWARWSIMPFTLVGGVCCCLWARDLCGATGGLLAQSPWTFCPNIVGHGALFMPDVLAAFHARHPKRFIRGVPRPRTTAAEVWMHQPESRPIAHTHLIYPRDTEFVRYVSQSH